MSELIATVDSVKSVDNLNIVTFNCNDIKLTMMSLDIDKDIQIGKRVLLGCKPSSIALAKDFQGVISFSNELECKVEDIEFGELLAMVSLKFEQFKLESLITKNTIDRMEIKKDDRVKAFIKASELSILEVLDNV